MEKPIWLALMPLVAVLALSSLGATGSAHAADSEGTEVYIAAEFIIPPAKKGNATDVRNQTVFKAQFRATRANMAAVDVSVETMRSPVSEGGSREITEAELRIKGRNVADPEDFKTFLTRQGVWRVLDADNKDIFTLKSIQRVFVGTDGDAQAVLVTTQQLSGAAKGAVAGTTLPIKLLLDGEETAMALKVAPNGKTAILTMPEFTEARAWQLRSLISQAPYPCKLSVTKFSFGDDVLRQVIGW